MSKRSYWLLCVWLSSGPAAGADFPQADQVRHDPFQRPDIPQKSLSDREVMNPVEQQAWSPKLSATLRSGKNSMANVNGAVIKLGETIDGYRLIEVNKRSAVFIKNEHRIQLTLDGEANE